MFIRIEKDACNEFEFENEHITIPEHTYQNLIKACDKVADEWERYNNNPNATNCHRHDEAVDELASHVMFLLGYHFKDVDGSGYWVHEGYVERNC